MNWKYWLMIAVVVIILLVWGYKTNWWGMSKAKTTTPAKAADSVVTTDPKTGQKVLLKVA